MGKTMRVRWAEGAIEQAVKRLEKIVLETDAEATHSVVGRPLSWMDLACLLDIARERKQHSAAWNQVLAVLPDGFDDEESVTPQQIAEAARDALLASRRRTEDCEQVLDALLPILRGHPLSKDEVHGDNLRAGYIARTAADVLRWYETELGRRTEELATARAKLEGQSRPLSLGLRGFVDQVNAMAERIHAQQDEIEQLQTRPSQWLVDDIALDCMNVVWRKWADGWRQVPRDSGVAFLEASITITAGPLVRLDRVPDEVDELGAVPAGVAQKLREAAGQ